MHVFSRPFSLLLAFSIVCFLTFVQSPQSAMVADTSLDISTLADPEGDLTFERVLTLDSAQFEPASRPDINFGYGRMAAWLRVVVTSETDRTVLLSMTPNFVDLIDIYVGREGAGAAAGDFSHVATGDHRPVPGGGHSGLDDSVELNLRAHEPTLVYIRLAALDSALTTELHVYAKDEGPFRETASVLMAGIWFGGMGILAVIQLVFFYYDRKPRNLLLAIATFMVAVVYTGSLGVSRLLLFPGGGVGNDRFVAVSIWLSLITSTLAAIHILDLKENSRWVYRIFLAFVAMGLVGMGFGMFGQHHLFAPVGNVATIGLAALAAFQGFRTANAGGAATQLRAAAYAALAIGVTAVMVQRTDLLPLPVWTVHLYAVASVLQTILLTAALGVRLRAAENLNRAMQQQALIAAQMAEEQARKLVEERTRELVAARQTAEDALEAELASQQQQVRFMEVISHQYRTPLASIRTHVDNIGLSLPPSDEANHTRLDRVRRGILRLVEVLEVNLSRSRLQGSAFRPVLVRTSAGDIAEAAAARGRDLLQCAIVTDIPSDTSMRVRADADMLGLAIINLLENAAKFSRSKSREPVVLSCRLDDGDVAISVADKGIGIPPGEIGSAFSSSWRGSNAAGVEGSGMGLSLVARIVAAHAGTVCIDSTEGQGTTVAIRLPALAD